MNLLVFDFETNGNGVDNKNNYKSYEDEEMPLPIPNFPIQISASLVNDNGNKEEVYTTFIKGSQRMDPWVKTHIPHITVEKCESEGITFGTMLKHLADMCSRKPTILVAHNIFYDWNVLINTYNHLKIRDSKSLNILINCQKFCTMYNWFTTQNKVGLKHAYYWKSKRIYIGPSLKTLATFFGITFDETKAHDASYDTEITTKCLECYKKIAPISNLIIDFLV